MSRADELRAEAAKIDDARQRAGRCLGRHWSDAEKIQVFDKLYELVSEYLVYLMHDQANKQFDMFTLSRKALLEACCGPDFLDWYLDIR